jgi:hypothetical protein
VRRSERRNTSTKPNLKLNKLKLKHRATTVTRAALWHASHAGGEGTAAGAWARPPRREPPGTRGRGARRWRWARGARGHGGAGPPGCRRAAGEVGAGPRGVGEPSGERGTGARDGQQGARREEEMGGGREGEEREGEGRGAHLGVQIRRSLSPKPRAQQGRERDGRER